MEHHGDLIDKPCVEMKDGDATIILRCKADDIYAEARHTFFVVKTERDLKNESITLTLKEKNS